MKVHRPKIVPAAVSLVCQRRAAGRCEDCGERKSLALHHLRYRTDDGLPIFGLETEQDLLALCGSCHRARHVDLNGEWWTDPQEREAYWQSFEDALAKDD